jgi:hypothetical protein
VPGYSKKAGATACNSAVAATLAAPLFVTTTSTYANGSIRRSLYVDLRGADVLHECRLAIDRDRDAIERRGSLPFTISSVRQVRPGLVLARFVPRIITHEPASMPGWKLAALSTEVMTGARRH